MKTPEKTVNDAVVNPLSRLMILLLGSWLIGSLYPIPETVFNLIIGPQQFGNGTVTHIPQWVDFQFMPVLGSFTSRTVLVSGPVAVFCVVCSALDRWRWTKVTLLSGLSNLSMCMLESWPDRSTNWMILNLAQLLIVGLFFLFIRPLREA